MSRIRSSLAVGCALLGAGVIALATAGPSSADILGNDGSGNVGVLNTGQGNTGVLNSGQQNTGVLNVGRGNIGVLNTGQFNLGILNAVGRNVGVFQGGDGSCCRTGVGPVSAPN